MRPDPHFATVECSEPGAVVQLETVAFHRHLRLHESERVVEESARALVGADYVHRCAGGSTGVCGWPGMPSASVQEGVEDVAVATDKFAVPVFVLVAKDLLFVEEEVCGSWD